MTFFQKLPTQIGLPTREGMGIPRTPPESRLAWWALGVVRSYSTSALCKIWTGRYNYAAGPSAQQAKRDSGGVRGIPIPWRVGSPIWVGNF